MTGAEPTDRHRIYTADEVLAMTFPPRVRLIDPILSAAGCVLVVGPPK
jgi:hypothetical protein